ncbi:MAG TPA: hypothetical protein PKJ08_03875 [Candidatus Cloacimonadota bacterium]|nr:hypothetical protein [Candidatus Cloacimonadota bacterium]HPM02816.1 hypothetical protein [Candidatus Cloacimonadota bacterium]
MRLKIRISIICMLICSILFLTACNYHIYKLKKEQFNVVRQNVKDILGDEYKVVKFKVAKEGYTNVDKTQYKVEFTFDLNKPVLIFRHTDLPGVLLFEKSGGNWKCVLNSGNPAQLFNIFQ